MGVRLKELRIVLLVGVLWLMGPLGGDWEGWWHFGEWVVGIVMNELP